MKETTKLIDSKVIEIGSRNVLVRLFEIGRNSCRHVVVRAAFVKNEIEQD